MDMDDLDDTRANPDSLLKVVEKEAEASRRGHLKIFFGYAAGSGKTYSMLVAAHAAQRRGVDVVAGYIEPHARPATAALVNGLEVIPPKRIEMAGTVALEFDLDAALKRSPQLILVDELAHTDAPGSRHKKRYQDVKELLHAGIDVYTTVNVQHIESLNDMVASITGVIVRERIPDSVFDEADQVELVDIEPEDLIGRLKAGEIYAPDQAGRALNNFFTVENLTALREIALRRCADRMNRLSDEARAKSNRDYHTGEHVLVCVSSSKSNPTILRTAARMAAAFKAEFTALYVKTPDTADLSQEDSLQLRANLELAEQLGARVVNVYGDDIAFQLAEFARLSGVSKLVMGRNTARRSLFGRSELTDRLIDLAPSLDIYIIPDKVAAKGRSARSRWHRARQTHGFARPRLRDLACAVALLVGATLVGYAFEAMGFATENITSAYLLATLVCAVFTANRICTVGVSLASVVLFNYCFVDPRYTFAFQPVYGPTFLVMLITALLASTLANLINDQARHAALTAYRTKVLFDTEQMLGQAETEAQVLRVTAEQLAKLLERDVVTYPEQPAGHLGDPFVVTAGDDPTDPEALSQSEAAVAAWAFKNNKHAGATTSTLPNSRCLYLAVRVNEDVYGVVGIPIDHKPLDAFENSIVLSIIGECALALESDHAAAEREEAAILARSERLRANLLRSLGHDLRTPLTSISGSAGILLKDDGSLGADKRHELASNIYDDSLWLINLVENLLSVTRIEDGTMKLKLNSELMDDAINEAVSHLSRESEGYNVVVEHPSGFILARMDIALIVQVLVNIIDNAIKYTPKGSTIQISSRRQGPNVLVEVADDGPGIPDTDKPRIFDMFYTSSANKPVDSRRSLGLGLSLCKSIVNAHGGDISVSDARPHGTIVRFTLPAEEVSLHE